MKKDLIILLLLIIPSFSWMVRPGYFSMHDDLQSLRQFELDKCFMDGQIPCRWGTDMGYGYGYPIFNYYPPFPYLLGQIYRWVGFSYIDVVKLVGITGFIATAIFMYLLGKDLWGRTGGIVSSLFYTYAPYHSVDYYVRGAVNEFWAMAFYPAAFYATRHLILSREKKWIVFTALAVAGVMLSHNPMLLIFAPLLVAWCLFWIVQQKNFKALIPLSGSAIFAFALSAFFTLPVVVESKFVSLWTLTAGYFNYLAHFLDWRQIFVNINWDYGSSIYGPGDTMSFALGYLHWIIPLVIAGSLVFSKKMRSQWPLISLLLVFSIGTLFMTHFKSTEIWKLIKPLEFLQFPWRFLTVSVFSVSILAGSIAALLNRNLVVVLLTALILINGNYFRAREWYPDMTDQEKFSGKSWQLLITSGIFDYLPMWAPRPPADGKAENMSFVSGKGTYETSTFKSNAQKYQVNVESEQAEIEIQTYYFPGWKMYVNGVQVEIDPSRDPVLGRMQADLVKGSHEVEIKLTDTPIRMISNIVSLISWLGLLGYGLWSWKKSRS